MSCFITLLPAVPPLTDPAVPLPSFCLSWQRLAHVLPVMDCNGAKALSCSSGASADLSWEQGGLAMRQGAHEGSEVPLQLL